ncbi:hypothetical protein [Picosynechococcus sp. NKBG15041c]|uniref:hypothetical protein n=1 Tax=Picosynechococcus sp. NKBG15041c TaxID=1407650 RepID=UPI0004670F49|nr:hypothetical protein [Picosynechococcus sp. NKBG15041c]
MFQLNEIVNYSLSEIREISKQINEADQDPSLKLDCEGVYGVEKNVWDAIFSNIRSEWKEESGGQFPGLIKFMENMNGDLMVDAYTFLTQEQKDKYSPNFNFLTSIDLLMLATQSEALCNTNPNLSIVQTRQFIELLAKYIASKQHLYDQISNKNLAYILKFFEKKKCYRYSCLLSFQ